MNRLGAALALSLALAAPEARAQGRFSTPLAAEPPAPRAVREVDIEEHLGRRLDGDLAFTDEGGRRVRLGDYLRGDVPTILVLAYYRCPMLCGLVLRGVVDGLNGIDWEPGAQYRALTVSFDPRDTPAAASAKQASTLAGLGPRGRDPSVWPFLVGDEKKSRALAEQIGFHYAYDGRTDQFAHPATAIILTPDGRVSRYLYGTNISARDLRLALLEAGEGKIGTIVDRVILTCYRYDPAARAYGPFMIGFMRIGGALILAVVAGALGVLFHGERRRKAEGGTP